MWRRKLATRVRKTEFWATVISVVALVVSVLTWLDVHAQLRLTSGQIRAYVQVVDVRLLETITDAGCPRSRWVCETWEGRLEVHLSQTGLV